MSALSLGTRHEGGHTVVSLTGDLDLATVPALREVAVAELTAAGCKSLVLDLDGLSFVDSTGLGCWIDLRNQAATAGREFALVNLPAVARRTVEMAGLADVFGVAADEKRGAGRFVVGPADETSAT